MHENTEIKIFLKNQQIKEEIKEEIKSVNINVNTAYQNL